MLQARGQAQGALAVQAQEERADVDVAQRDREITEIARSIGQLAELFRDLGQLVIDQGSLLDSVEYNVEQTAVHIEDAATQLGIAETCVLLFSFSFSSSILPAVLLYPSLCAALYAVTT